MNSISDNNTLEIKARNLEVQYSGVPALSCKKLDLQGRVISVIGHNGAGKSTLIKTMLDLLPVASGFLKAMHRENDRVHPIIPSKHMAFCPEEGSVFADITVESYVSLWCKLKRGNGKYYRKEGSHYVERLDLLDLLPKLGRSLSKGERRRVQTAVGFLSQPKLFLLDEPFDGLDVRRAHELVKIISEESAQMTFLISSHRLDIIEWLSDSLVVLSQGRIAASGSLEIVCSSLSDQTLVLEGVARQSKAVLALEQAFPGCFIRTLGDSLFLTGKNVTAESILSVLKSVGISEGSTQIRAEKPGLVDAMNYHLQQPGEN